MALATNIQEQNTQGLNGLSSAFAFAATAGEITKLSMVNGSALRGDKQDQQNEINAGSATRAGNGELSNTAGTASAAENYKSQRIGAQDKANEERKRNLWMQQMMALQDQINEAIADIDTRLGDIESMETGIQEVFDEGVAETTTDANGNTVLENERAERALQEYEDRTGQTIDRNDSAAVLEALQEQMEEYAREREELRLEREELEIRYEKNKDIYENGTLEEQQIAIETANNDYQRLLQNREEDNASDNLQVTTPSTNSLNSLMSVDF